MVTVGSLLDGNGQPIAGTGFEYHPGGTLSALLEKRISPLFSHPHTGEWVFGLAGPAETGGEYARGVGVFREDNAGPAEHFHPFYTEQFEVLQGDFLFILAGQEHRLVAGGRITIGKGIPHTFRCIDGGFGAVITETRPAARIGEIIPTLFGMAHDDKLTGKGNPGLFQAMAIGGELGSDTVFTSPPPALVSPLTRLLAPLARALGYRATYSRYRDDEFWSERVQQP